MSDSVLPMPSMSSPDAALGTPTTPTTPISPAPKAKKANPLNDLIETEKAYVDNLTGIIRKVAAAWSRSNLPPPQLDTMFRSIEGVYKANRSLLSKLKEAGPNPSNPKLLGDLLMRWIDDLETPYTNYCNKFSCGFDFWEPVQSNPKLHAILGTFSETNPPAGADAWTLDGLFLLPKGRLKYYRKLYSRLMKTTAPGKSDHKLLVRALEKLDRLLDTLENRSSVRVESAGDAAPVETEDEVVIDMRKSLSPPAPMPASLPPSGRGSAHGSESGSAIGSSVGERLSRETTATSVSRGSNSTLSMPISTLERRLSTQRTLDIFTMTPKVVKLQMSPPNLTFTREMRTSAAVVIRFVPRVTDTEVVHQRGHIYLLSDLFLICERMTPEEQGHPGNEGADTWLCYPPLAGKVLRVSDVPGQDNALQVSIMRKENLILETESVQQRDHLLSQFKECIEFSGSLPPPSKVAPPPVPPINARFQTSPRQSQELGTPNTQDGPPPPDYQMNDNRMPPPNGQFRGPMGGPPPGPHNPNAVVPPARSTSFQGMGGPPPPHGPGMPPMGPNGAPRGPPGGPQGGPPFAGGPGGPPPHMGGPPPPHMGGPPPPHMGGPPPPHMGGPPPHMGGPPPGHPMHQPPFPPQNRPFGGPGGPPPGPFPPGQFGPGGPGGLPPRPGLPSGPGMGLPPRPPSEPSMGIHKSPSTRSLNSQYSHRDPNSAPPLPPFASPYGNPMLRNNSQPNLHAPQPRPMLPSMASRATSMIDQPSFDDPSPPGSPIEETPRHTGPVTSVVTAQMKCKVFLQQQHAQWKSLGSARLKLYREDPTNIKQLVVEADNKDKTILISTIVLSDGVERVGKTGVAIELSSQGVRTGIVYMIQLRNEKSAGGLFDSLLAGSDRGQPL